MKTITSPVLSSLFLSLALSLVGGCDGADAPSDPLAERGVELLDEEHFEAFSSYLVEIDGVERQILSYNGPQPTTLVVEPGHGRESIAVSSRAARLRVPYLP